MVVFLPIYISYICSTIVPKEATITLSKNSLGVIKQIKLFWGNSHYTHLPPTQTKLYQRGYPFSWISED